MNGNVLYYCCELKPGDEYSSESLMLDEVENAISEITTAFVNSDLDKGKTRSYYSLSLGSVSKL